nr:hypothetical protein [Tanacetum cinerariifolium]
MFSSKHVPLIPSETCSTSSKCNMFSLVQVKHVRQVKRNMTVEGVDFTGVPDDDTTLTFLIDLATRVHLTGKDYQEYGLPIPDVMLTDAIKHSESYQMFIKYSTHHIPPKKSIGKEKTASRRVVQKKVTLSVDDNIISDDPDAALELAKSISKTKTEEAEATRKVHDTHARIVTESVPESAKKKSGGRRSCKHLSSTEIKHEAGKRKPGTGGSNEGSGTIPGVPDEPKVISSKSSKRNGAILGVLDESIVIYATLSKGIGTKLGVLIEEKDITKEKDDKDGDADDEGDDHVSDTQDADDEDVKTESYEDKICDEDFTDASKEEIKKNSKVKDDTKKIELPPSSSSLSVSSVQKVPVSVIPEIINLLPIHEIPTETPVSTNVSSPQVTLIISSVQQTPTPIPTQPITIEAPTITAVVPESNALTAVELRVAKLEKDHLPELTKKPTPIAEQESEKSPSDILKIKKEYAEKQKKPQFTIKSIDKAALEEYDLKSALYQSMHANKSY